MIERSADQDLKIMPLQLQVLSRINPQPLRMPQRFGTRDAKANDQNIAPFQLDLFNQLLAFFAPQVDEEEGRMILLQHRIEPVGVIDMAHFDRAAQESACAPNEIRIFSIEDAGGGRDHAAATSSSKRTSGSRI